MTDPFKIDLRSLTDSERELVELAIQQLAEAVAIDHDPANVEAISRAYRNAGAVVKALQLLQARKSAKPKAAKRTAKNANIPWTTEPLKKPDDSAKPDPFALGEFDRREAKA